MASLAQAHASELIGLPFLSLETLPPAAMLAAPCQGGGGDAISDHTCSEQELRWLLCGEGEGPAPGGAAEGEARVRLNPSLGNLVQAVEWYGEREKAPLSPEELEANTKVATNIGRAMRSVLKI